MDEAVHLGKHYQDNLHSTKKHNKMETIRRDTEIDFDSRRHLRDIYDSLGHTTMGKNFFAEWQSSPTVDSKSIRLLWFGALPWQSSSTLRSHRQEERKDSMVYRFSWIPWIAPDWRRTSGVRVKIFSGHITSKLLHEISKMMGDMNYIILKYSQTRSYSCRCTTTSNGETRRTDQFVMIILRFFRNMQENTLKDICHSSDEDLKKSCSECEHINQTENGIRLLKLWWIISEKADIPYFVHQVHWTEELWKVEEVEICRYTFVVTDIPQSWFFAPSSPLTSSVSTEQCRTWVKSLRSEFRIILNTECRATCTEG